MGRYESSQVASKIVASYWAHTKTIFDIGPLISHKINSRKSLAVEWKIKNDEFVVVVGRALATAYVSTFDGVFLVAFYIRIERRRRKKTRVFNALHSWFQINVIIELNVHLWNCDFIFCFVLAQPKSRNRRWLLKSLVQISQIILDTYCNLLFFHFCFYSMNPCGIVVYYI